MSLSQKLKNASLSTKLFIIGWLATIGLLSYTGTQQTSQEAINNNIINNSFVFLVGGYVIKHTLDKANEQTTKQQ